MLKDQGRDGSEQPPRGDYRKKALEIWDIRRDLKEEREIISGTERHSLFQRGNDEQKVMRTSYFPEGI